MPLLPSLDQPVAIRSGFAKHVQAWSTATRPKSLLVAMGPVFVGASAAMLQKAAWDWRIFLLVLFEAAAVQVICNLQNDAGFHRRGGDAAGSRVGLPRATTEGWLTFGQVRMGIVVTALAALAPCVYLAALLGWPVLAIGAVSLAGALAYMGGPRPVAYTPYGELTVFVYFGLIAVTGTEWAMSGSVSAAGCLASIPVGTLAAAAMAVNNHRDQAHDRSIGRRTFAVTYGTKSSARLYSFLLFMPYVGLAAVAGATAKPQLLLPALTLPLARRLSSDLHRRAPGPEFNPILFRTFRLGFLFNALLAASLYMLSLHP